MYKSVHFFSPTRFKAKAHPIQDSTSNFSLNSARHSHSSSRQKPLKKKLLKQYMYKSKQKQDTKKPQNQNQLNKKKPQRSLDNNKKKKPTTNPNKTKINEVNIRNFTMYLNYSWDDIVKTLLFHSHLQHGIAVWCSTRQPSMHWVTWTTKIKISISQLH